MDFNLQDYLEAMEARSMARFDAIDEQLQDIPELKTRVALLEQTSDILKKGVWTTFTASMGAVVTYVISYFRHP